MRLLFCEARVLQLCMFTVLGIQSESHHILTVINELVSLRCTPKSQVDIQWHFNSPDNYVYAGGRFWGSCRERCHMETDNTNGTYIYIMNISNVKPEDAGQYNCHEEITGRRISSTNLTVLESSPTCSSNTSNSDFIGPNTCNVQQEDMTFYCALSFSGNSPLLTWKSAVDNQTWNSSFCEDQPNRRNCSLTLRPYSRFHGSVLTCQIATSDGRATPFNCSTEAVKLQYISAPFYTAEKTTNQNVSCDVETNLNVTFNWILKTEKSESFVSSENNILIKSPGIYRCEVTYTIANITCTTLVSAVNVSKVIVREEKHNIGNSLIISFVVVLLTIFAIVASVIFIRSRRKQEERPSEMLTLLNAERVIQQNIEHQREKLIDIIECDFGLLDKLVKKGALTNREHMEVTSLSKLCERNRILLNFLLTKKKEEVLIEQLLDSMQFHVVNFVKGNGEYKEEFGLDWPLPEGAKMILNCNHESLVEILDTSELLPMLISRKIIGQAKIVFSESAVVERNKFLLERVRRFSIKSYKTLIKCLNESRPNQKLVAKILRNYGVIVPVHATLQSDNLDEAERKIVDQMTKLLCLEGATMEKARRILDEVFVSTLAVKRGNSIVIYICCNEESEFAHLCKLIDNSTMQTMLEQAFNVILEGPNSNFTVKVLEAKITREDKAKFERTFRVLFSQMVGNIRANLEFTSERYSLERLTKLRNNVYALIYEDPDGYYINIYDDKRVSVLKRIEIKDLNYSIHFAANEKDNCIYVFGCDTSDDDLRMWMIRETVTDSGKAFEVLQSLTSGKLNSYSLAHCSSEYFDGQLMIIDNNKRPVNLIFFGPKDQRLRVITLHEDIISIYSAVKASTGHFIVCCKLKKRESFSRERSKEDEDIVKENDDKVSANTAEDDDDHDDGCDDDEYDGEHLKREVIVALCKLSRKGKKIIRYLNLEALGIYEECSLSLCINSCGCVFLTLIDKVILFDPNFQRNQILNLGADDDIGCLRWSFHDYEKKQLIIRFEAGFKIYTLSLN